MHAARVVACALLAVPLAFAQEPPGFPGPTRTLSDPDARITVTVPDSWKAEAADGNLLLRVRAPGSYGGHDLMVALEHHMGDRAAQRERYLEYDARQQPGAAVQKVDDPWFGYRLVNRQGNRVLVRSFLTSGNDGLVLTVTSRFARYDDLYRDLIEAVVASARAGDAPERPADAEPVPAADAVAGRVFDPAGRVSIVLPPGWTQEETLLDEEKIQIARGEARTDPRVLLKDWGGPTSPALSLVKVSAQWTRAYGALAMDRLDDPPRLVVHNRVPGCVDYLTAIPHDEDGYVLQLTVKKDAYDALRPLADALARSVHFADAPWSAPEPPVDGVSRTVRGVATLHAPAGGEAALAILAETLDGFEDVWKEIGLGGARRAEPVAIAVVKRERFAEAADGFGVEPAAYDPLRRTVVVLPPPADPEGRGTWCGALYAALARARLHRDLPVPAPAWLAAGLAAVAEAGGRAGDDGETPHPTLLAELQAMVAAGETPSFATLESERPGAFLPGASPRAQAVAWGYAHLFAFGRGPLVSHWKRWARDLEKAEGTAPPFERKGYDRSAEDLAKHLERITDR